MKKILIIGIMLLACIAAKAQQYQQAPGYLYSYDANGNRTMREYKMINIQATKIKDTTAQHGDSTSVIAAQQAAQQQQLLETITEVVPGVFLGNVNVAKSNEIYEKHGEVYGTELSALKKGGFKENILAYIPSNIINAPKHTSFFLDSVEIIVKAFIVKTIIKLLIFLGSKV